MQDSGIKSPIMSYIVEYEPSWKPLVKAVPGGLGSRQMRTAAVGTAFPRPPFYSSDAMVGRIKMRLWSN
jgi:hypothetical protein